MRHFTVAEANEQLEAVRPVAERMVRHRRILARNHAELDRLRRKAAGNGGGLDAEKLSAAEAEATKAAAHVARAIEELEALGVQVKDLDAGLIDFPASHPETGETVLLCWRLGEPEVAYWHGIDEGFRGRKHLPF